MILAACEAGLEKCVDVKQDWIEMDVLCFAAL